MCFFKVFWLKKYEGVFQTVAQNFLDLKPIFHPTRYHKHSEARNVRYFFWQISRNVQIKTKTKGNNNNFNAKVFCVKLAEVVSLSST